MQKLDRIKHAKESEAADSKLGTVVAKWRDFDFPASHNGKWLYESFVMSMKHGRELVAAIDPSVSPDLPPHLLDPAVIANFLAVPVEEFNWHGGQADQPVITEDLEGGLQQKLDKITNLLIQQKSVKEWYSTSEVAERLGNAKFTVREWCRLGQCKAEKKKPYRGGKKQWMIPRDEMLKLESDGPAPFGTFQK